MSNIEEQSMNAEEPLNMEGGEAQMNSEEPELETMTGLVGGKRRRPRRGSSKKSKSQSKSKKNRKSKKNSKQKKQRKTKKGGSYKSGAVGTAAAPLLLLGMQQILAKKLGKNKKSRRSTRRARKN